MVDNLRGGNLDLCCTRLEGMISWFVLNEMALKKLIKLYFICLVEYFDIDFSCFGHESFFYKIYHLYRV